MRTEHSVVTVAEKQASAQQRLWWIVGGYGAMLLFGVGCVYLILRYGATLTAPQAVGPAVASATSHASILVPFLLGALLALLLYPRLADYSVPFSSFALFMGIAMSITAFPVLARILTDRGMVQSELGIIALSCAAVDDITAWCLLAFVVGIAQSQLGESMTVIGWTLLYLAVMFLLVRPGVRWLVTRWTAPTLSRAAVAIVLSGCSSPRS